MPIVPGNGTQTASSLDGWYEIGGAGRVHDLRSIPGGVYAHVIPNRTVPRAYWALTTDADTVTPTATSTICSGSVEINHRDGLTKREALEIARLAAREIVEYLLDNLGGLGVEF